MKYEADYLFEPYSSTNEHVANLNFSNPSFSVNFSYRLKPTGDNCYRVFTEHKTFLLKRLKIETVMNKEYRNKYYLRG